MERTLTIIQSKCSPYCIGQGHLPLTKVSHSLIQTGLGHCHGWGTHSLPEQPVPLSQHIAVKNFVLISNLYFPFFTLYPLLLDLSLVFYEKSLARFPVDPLQMLEVCDEVFIQPPLLQVEQPQNPVGLLTRGAPGLINFVTVLCTCFNSFMSFLC